jgi:hypothetical protein
MRQEVERGWRDPELTELFIERVEHLEASADGPGSSREENY